MTSHQTQYERASFKLPLSAPDLVRRYYEKVFSEPTPDSLMAIAQTNLFQNNKSYFQFVKSDNYKTLLLKCPLAHKVEVVRKDKVTTEHAWGVFRIARAYNAQTISKDNLEQAQLFPILNQFMQQALNTTQIEDINLTPAVFEEEILRAVTSNGQYQLCNDKAKTLVQELSIYLANYWGNILRLISHHAVVEHNYSQTPRLRDRSLLPINIYLLLEKLGIVEGLLETFKDGTLVTQIIDLVCWNTIDQDQARGSGKDYQDEYITFSNSQLSSRLYTTVCQRITNLIERGFIKQTEYVNHQAITELFEKAIGHAVTVELQKLPDSISKEELAQQVKQEQAKAIEQIKARYAKTKPKRPRGRPAQGIDMAEFKAKRGRPTNAELAQREAKEAQLEKLKKLALKKNEQIAAKHQQALIEHQQQMKNEIAQVKLKIKNNLLTKAHKTNQLVSHLSYLQQTAGIKGDPKIHLLSANVNNTLFCPQYGTFKRRYYLDLTTFCSTAEGNVFVQFGPVAANKTQFKELFKILVMIDHQTGLPVVFEAFSGAHSETKAMIKVMKRISKFLTPDSLLITDRGFARTALCKELIARDIKFLMMNVGSSAEHAQLIDEAGEDLICKYFDTYDGDFGVSYVTKQGTAYSLGICDEQGYIDGEDSIKIDPQQTMQMVCFTQLSSAYKDQENYWEELRLAAKFLNENGLDPENKSEYAKLLTKTAEGVYVINRSAFKKKFVRQQVHSFITNANIDDALLAFNHSLARWSNDFWLPGLTSLANSDSLFSHNTIQGMLRISISLITATLERHIMHMLKNVNLESIVQAKEIMQALPDWQAVVRALNNSRLSANAHSQITADLDPNQDALLVERNKRVAQLARQVVRIPMLSGSYVLQLIHRLQNTQAISD